MTNEELTLLIQGGDRGKIMDLWKQVNSWAYVQARHYLTACGRVAGVTMDDMMQSAFIALMRATETYQAEHCSFTTWMTYYLKQELHNAVGLRTKTESQDPIRCASSISQPISDIDGGEDLTIEGTLEDYNAAAALEEIDNEDLRRSVLQILHQLPKPQQQAIIKKYYAGCALTKEEKKAHDKAIRALRHPRTRCEIMKCFQL